MKLSVSISDDDLAILDDCAHEAGLPSRSAAVQRAIQLLRHANLEDDYAAAFEEWASSGEQAEWETVTGDGLTDDAR